LTTSLLVRRFYTGALAALSLFAGPRIAEAQGCILIRQSAPIVGSLSTTFLRPGEWQLDITYRDSTADRHYSLDVFQEQRTTLGTNVVNTQKQSVFSLSHSFTPRVSVSVTVPIVVASWSIPSPTTPTPGARATQHGRGLGDISSVARAWLLDPLTHANRNVAIGVGLKAPTGSADATDTFVDLSGLNSAEKAVDQSVQPGDGGWAAQFEVQAFTSMKRAFLFGSANYLLNPKNTNATPSILVGIGRPSTTVPLRNVNSVPDQFVVRAGAGIPVWRGIGASLAWRVEGVPRYDIVGRSDGFRRPGREMFIEPGLSYANGRSTLQINVPRAFYRYRAPDPYTGANGDATFPDWVVMATYSFRFGSVKHVAMPAEK